MSTDLLTDQPATEDEDTGSTRRAMDPELRTLGTILRLLDDMDEAARGRVVRYLHARFASE